MKREDHILWKIVKAHEIITEYQFQRARGELDPSEYAARIQPICLEVMNRILTLIEMDGFITKTQEEAKLFSNEMWDEPDRHINKSKEYNERVFYLFTRDWIARDYDKFIKLYRHAIFEPDPIKRASELVIGLDSFVNWMHGCYYVSGQVMRASPITGDAKKDYEIALHTMYLLYYKDPKAAIPYLIDKIPSEF